MTEPQQILVRAVTDALREAGASLRKRGWPMELIVERVPERDTYSVSLRFELPAIPTPIEATQASAGRSSGEAMQANRERGKSV